jgi:hypothetical protein
MRLLSCLEYERSFGGRWGSYFVRIPFSCIYIAQDFWEHTFLSLEILSYLSSIFSSQMRNSGKVLNNRYIPQIEKVQPIHD